MKLPGDPWNNLWSGFNEIASVSMEFHGKCPNPLWKLSMEKFPWKLVSLSSMQFHGNLFDGDIFHEIDVLILHGIPWRFSTRVVTIVRAQHKRSLFLMVIIHRFFLFSRSRHRRPGLRLLSRPEPGPRIDTNTTPTWKPRVGLNDSLLLNLPANWANSSSKRAVRCKNPPTVKLADCTHAWTHEPWWRSWQNDGQVAVGVPIPSRWLDACLRSKPVPHHPQPPGPAVDVTEHWIELGNARATSNRVNQVFCLGGFLLAHGRMTRGASTLLFLLQGQSTPLTGILFRPKIGIGVRPLFFGGTRQFFPPLQFSVLSLVGVFLVNELQDDGFRRRWGL